MGDVEDTFQFLNEKFDAEGTQAMVQIGPDIVKAYAEAIVHGIEIEDWLSISKQIESSKNDKAKSVQLAALCIHFPSVAVRVMHFLYDRPKHSHRSADKYKPLIYSRTCSLKVRLENDDIDSNEFEIYKKTWRDTSGSGRFDEYIQGLGAPLISKSEAIQKLKYLRHSDKDCVERAFRIFNIDISILNG